MSDQDETPLFLNSEPIPSPNSKKVPILQELLDLLSNPYHQRLVKTYIQEYENESPVGAMEAEFQTILLEILDSEN
jgi:hypothetical protein